MTARLRTTSISTSVSGQRGGMLAWLGRILPTTFVLAALGSVASWGHHSGWTLPQFSVLMGKGAADKEDWCPAHGVPESQCVECNPELMPAAKPYGWCRKHGVPNCPFEHPEVAQVPGTPEVSPADLERAERALALMPRPQNNSKCKLHQRRIQFASMEAFQRAAIEVEPVWRAPMSEFVRANGEVSYDPTRVARLSSRAAGTVWRVDKKVGDPVKAGETIVLIEAREIGRAKSELLHALAQLRLSIRNNTRLEKAILAAFPDEVEHVWGRIGTAEVATDPMGVELTDVFITLKTRDQWKKAATQAELTEKIEKVVRELPGQKISFSQPIELRINEMISGVRSDVAVKLFGDDLNVLKARAEDIERVLKSIPGNADVNTEQVTGQPVLQVRINQEEIARYGVPASAVLDLVESIGGKPLGEVVEGQLRFPLVVRLPEALRNSSQTIEAMLIATPSGERIPVSRLATVEVVEGPSTITREWAQRRITVTSNVRGRDMGSFVAEAQRKIKEQVQLPPGRYHVEWGGQFEHYQSARKRLLIVVPLAILLILTLLYLTYGNVVDAFRVFTGVPLGWVGGIIALWLRDMPFSISAAIGFIAMSGVAVLDDMILVSYIRHLRAKGLPRDEAVRQAAVTRLRPVLMTTLVASLGFLPMAFGTGMGAEMQRPLATVVLGGVVSAMVMSLLVIRVLYVFFDSLAVAAQRLLMAGLGLRAEQLSWLFGEHGWEEVDRAEVGARDGTADASANFPEQARA
jgi:biotin carboxyl carrier protein